MYDSGEEFLNELKKQHDDDSSMFLINEIENLSKRDKEILILRYGLNNKKEYTQKEVADMLGISQSYISRIEKKAIKRLKSLMKV